MKVSEHQKFDEAESILELIWSGKGRTHNLSVDEIQTLVTTANAVRKLNSTASARHKRYLSRFNDISLDLLSTLFLRLGDYDDRLQKLIDDLEGTL